MKFIRNLQYMEIMATSLRIIGDLLKCIVSDGRIVAHKVFQRFCLTIFFNTQGRLEQQ